MIGALRRGREQRHFAGLVQRGRQGLQQRGGSIVLRVRRQSDAVDLVIEGTGASPELVQSGSSNGWQGQLTIAVPNGLRLGPQRLSLPEANPTYYLTSALAITFPFNILAGIPIYFEIATLMQGA